MKLFVLCFGSPQSHLSSFSQLLGLWPQMLQSLLHSLDGENFTLHLFGCKEHHIFLIFSFSPSGIGAGPWALIRTAMEQGGCLPFLKAPWTSRLIFLRIHILKLGEQNTDKDLSHQFHGDKKDMDIFLSFFSIPTPRLFLYYLCAFSSSSSSSGGRRDDKSGSFIRESGSSVGVCFCAISHWIWKADQESWIFYCFQ